MTYGKNISDKKCSYRPLRPVVPSKQLARELSAKVLRAMTVSTYVVGFLLFLAEYFSSHAFCPMFMGLRRALLRASNFSESSRAATVTERLLGIRKACLVPAMPG